MVLLNYCKNIMVDPPTTKFFFQPIFVADLHFCRTECALSRMKKISSYLTNILLKIVEKASRNVKKNNHHLIHIIIKLIRIGLSARASI